MGGREEGRVEEEGEEATKTFSHCRLWDAQRDEAGLSNVWIVVKKKKKASKYILSKPALNFE